LHTFFGLAEFCKKPCNLVFNVLQFFKKKVKNVLLFTLPMFCIAGAGIEPPTVSPAGIVALTTDIPSSLN
jgi:hypothetical protein